MATPSLFPEEAHAASKIQPPQFSVKTERHKHSITIGPWTIIATKKPILNGKEIDASEKALNLPLPEMTFGNNSLTLTYEPPTSSTQTSLASADASTGNSSERNSQNFTLSFKTIDALSGVATGEGWEERVGGGVLVSMAEKWGQNKSWASENSTSTTSPGQTASSGGLFDVPVPSKPVKPHDWTYSTLYAGSITGTSTFIPSPTHSLPLTLLARQDPVLDQILYYEDVPLYEDELHDNGESMLNTRIRVMPHCFFILSRLFVRVDNVLFRMYDVRLYHAFGSSEIIREVKGMEAGYGEVKRHLEKPTDLSPLTDPNWVYRIMQSLSSLPPQRRQFIHRRSSSSAGSKNGKPWPGLGEKVDVLRLPQGDGVQEIEAKLGEVKI
ncbi:hypothetical protein, variant [Cryptococcus amylolentus CBS 6039]|uniref:Type 2A phosphatase activator TIP41 n=1 Tax=Cryptococcus amylolentus CBS 6039 TaxID=1295533 RepID=A0A1E3HUM9_9TREE|nr:hypothetical protein, variant [Cryptococcus amylolentus CBS 6039]ODN79446.1 hypothetical protein, variant [Cryptococcus amylolentus CBS 6039]